jgi:hypothetical protein
MKTFSLGHDHQRLNADASAALERFGLDVKLMCTASTRGTSVSTGALQARAIRAYRTALCEAAGRPNDCRWTDFASAVAALVAAAAPDISHLDVAAATSRLRALLDENADLLV